MEWGDGIDFSEAEVVQALREFAERHGVKDLPPANKLQRVGFGRRIREETGCVLGLRAIKPKEGQSDGS